MKDMFGIMIVSILVFGGTGCGGSFEHHQAVEQEDSPWFVVAITSSDSAIQEGEMNIYKLLRKVNSPEGKREKLKVDKSWGDGHTNIRMSDSTTIKIHAQISQDKSESKVCNYKLSAFHLNGKEQAYFSIEMNKLDRCEKSEFQNPYFSGRIQTEGREWKTLNFSFKRTG